MSSFVENRSYLLFIFTVTCYCLELNNSNSSLKSTHAAFHYYSIFQELRRRHSKQTRRRLKSCPALITRIIVLRWRALLITLPRLIITPLYLRCIHIPLRPHLWNMGVGAVRLRKEQRNSSSTSNTSSTRTTPVLRIIPNSLKRIKPKKACSNRSSLVGPPETTLLVQLKQEHGNRR
jgi:hypothetical protein